ncbi:MAG: type II toxin-antitoxin system PemK/MazF family toxin [Deltaproteobacteria bacterium]|nr:type II toxin-antitoxin system PemK/MazF family toxin [Deltaproteobacteria bacterium]MCB9785413.1 type II toxin-antitoxin system PemK/MazF family toxin [Deltaproteobacteria bacterium]
MKQAIGRGDVYLVDLEPTQGREIQKTRPCLVVSPDELNAHLRTFIVAPLTTGSYAYPFRIPCRVAGKSGHVVLDQLRTVDASRLIHRVGRIPAPTLRVVLERLREMFEP